MCPTSKCSQRLDHWNVYSVCPWCIHNCPFKLVTWDQIKRTHVNAILYNNSIKLILFVCTPPLLHFLPFSLISELLLLWNSLSFLTQFPCLVLQTGLLSNYSPAELRFSLSPLQSLVCVVLVACSLSSLFESLKTLSLLYIQFMQDLLHSIHFHSKYV